MRKKTHIKKRSWQSRWLCFLFMLFSCLSFSSCIEGIIYDPDEPGMADTDFDHIPGFMTVRLRASDESGTRAGETSGDHQTSDGKPFDDGAPSEYAFAPGDHHFVILYNQNDGTNAAPVALLGLTPYTVILDDDPVVGSGDNAHINYDNLTLTVTSLKTTRDFPLDPKELEADPKEALKKFLTGKEAYVLINTSLTRNELMGTNGSDGMTKSQLLKASVGSYTIRTDNIGTIVANDGTEYFTMCNTVYLSGGKKKISAEINPYNIFEKEKDARENPAIVAYVERLAAKYTLTFEGYASEAVKNVNIPGSGTVSVYKGLTINGTSYTIESDEKGWELKVLGYGLNALEQNSYLFRHISESDYDATWAWNDESHHRSYWAEDEHYEINSETRNGYPHQFRQALETDSVRSLHKAENGYIANNINPKSIKDGYYLDYVDFNTIAGIASDGSLGNYPSTIYSHENTYFDAGTSPNDWLWKRGYFSAGTHIIIAAQLMIYDTNNSNDLYRDQNSIFYISKEQILQSKLDILNKVVLSGGNSGIRILNTDWQAHSSNANESQDDILDIVAWNAGSVLWVKKNNESDYRPATLKDIDFIEAEVSGGDGQLLIAPKYLDTEADYYLAPVKSDGISMENGTYKDAENHEHNIAVKINFNHLVSLIHKIIGPVDHYNQGYMYYAAPITHRVQDMKNVDSWKTVGHIGVVRNTWYKLNIKKFNEVGRPVDNPAQPIFPTLDVKRDYLNMTVTILTPHWITQTEVPVYP